MSNEEHSDDEAVYVISIASQLSGMHPQTLRQYDRMGLVSPGRASGRGRRYSLTFGYCIAAKYSTPCW